MPSVKPDEAAFESFICAWLLDHGGYDNCKVGTVLAASPGPGNSCQITYTHTVPAGTHRSNPSSAAVSP